MVIRPSQPHHSSYMGAGDEAEVGRHAHSSMGEPAQGTGEHAKVLRQRSHSKDTRGGRSGSGLVTSWLWEVRHPMAWAICYNSPSMPEKRKRHRTFHVNMLKQWNSPVASVLAVRTEQVEESDGQIVMVGDGCEGTPTLGQLLSQTQVQELQELINTMPEVFTDKPGRTTASEHCIDTADAQPVQISPYRIPRHGCNRRSERCWIWVSSNHVGVHGHHQLWQ